MILLRKVSTLVYDRNGPRYLLKRFVSTTSKKKSLESSPLVPFDITTMEKLMNECVQRFSTELSTLRIGKAATSLLDSIKILLNEKSIPLYEIAQITVKDPQNLNVTVYDETLLPQVEKTIRTANLNLNPIVEQRSLRVPIPKLTKEYRETIVKQIQKVTEKTKVDVRDVRQKGMKLIRSQSDHVSQDDTKSSEKKVFLFSFSFKVY
jgi:ribosome recycling factor